MDIKELRIGNLVKFARLPRDFGMTSGIDIVDKYIFLSLLQCKIIREGISPIPLEEGWLLKFGFRLVDFEKNELTGETYYLYESSCGNFQIFKQMGIFKCEKCVNKEIKTVHQLQNLYFALTGEELILKD